MNLMDISNTLFSGHGFGINTNILETNVINLAVVIAVVISVVGDALRELLTNRKQKILDNIALADNRAKEMQKRIADAKSELTKAEARADKIRKQGLATAEREKNLCIAQAEDEATRLKQFKDDSIRLQQQKAIQQISQQIVALSVQQARKKLKPRVSRRNFQLWINEGKMAKYVTITKEAARLNKKEASVT